MKRRIVLSGIAGLAVLAASGAAYAAWSADGSGVAQVKAVTQQGVVILASTPDPTLYPGASVALDIKINNPNSYTVRILSVLADGNITSDKPDCDSAGSGVTFAPVIGLTKQLGAHRTITLVLPGAISMSVSSPEACSGATFNVPVHIVAEQAVSTSSSTATTTSIDLSNDPRNCGTVGNDVTVLPHATGMCVGGQAAIQTCDYGWQDIDGVATNGCEHEIDFAHDPNNCGTEGTVVPPEPNAVTGCVNGLPQIITCDPGWEDTDGVFVDGCEHFIGPAPAAAGVKRS